MLDEKRPKPGRGEVWLIDLNPTKGHEQAGRRPCLVLSDDMLNHGPADVAVVLPITSTDRGIPSHVRIDAPEGGLRNTSFVKCEDMRSVSVSARFIKRLGAVEARTLADVERIVRYLLGL